MADTLPLQGPIEDSGKMWITPSIAMASTSGILRRLQGGQTSLSAEGEQQTSMSSVKGEQLHWYTDSTYTST